MKSCRIIRRALLNVVLASLAGTSVNAQTTGTPEIDSALAGLKATDAERRLSALEALEVSLDPRIPDAALALLLDEGETDRRRAARAVGSRWWQIPSGQKRDFIAALKKLSKDDEGGAGNMADRGIGLIDRSYKGPMFSRSPDKRWVIYERRGLPCLIDTTTSTEELLGWTPDYNSEDTWPCFSPYIGNGLITPQQAVVWHPKSDRAALEIVTVGHPRPQATWVWQHRVGLTKLAWEDIVSSLVKRQEFPPDNSKNVFDGQILGWKGDELQLEFSTGTIHEMVVGWNSRTHDLRLISKGTEEH